MIEERIVPLDKDYDEDEKEKKEENGEEIINQNLRTRKAKSIEKKQCHRNSWVTVLTRR